MGRKGTRRHRLLAVLLPLIAVWFVSAALLTILPSPIDTALPLLPHVETTSPPPIYVDPHGLDTNPGTLPAPLQNIQAGIDRLKPGGTLILRGGTYTPAAPLIVRRSGTPDRPIRIAAFPREKPVVDGRGILQNVVRIDGQSWLVVEGLTVQNAAIKGAGSAISITGGANHIQLQSVVASGAPVAAIAIGASASHIQIVGCDVSGSSTGILISGHSVLIDGCSSHNNNRMVNNGADCGKGPASGGEHGAQAFAVYRTNGPVEIQNSVAADNVADSLCYGADGVAFELFDAQNVRIHHNRSWDNTNTLEIGGATEEVRFWRNQASAEVFLTAHDAKDLMIVNNTIWNSKPSIWVGPSRFGAGSTAGFVFVNNIVVADKGPLVFVSLAWDPQAVVDHNLYFAPPSLGRFGYVGGRFFGTFTAWQTGSGQDADSRYADPLMFDPASGDFRLRPGSPAIDAGTPVAGITDGFAGTAPDIGAIESTP